MYGLFFVTVYYKYYYKYMHLSNKILLKKHFKNEIENFQEYCLQYKI